jgi:putative membrane-bound dehydrogenase-like protein
MSLQRFTLFLPLALAASLAFGAEPANEKDYRVELPRIPPRSPVEALKSFQIRPGFRVELVAAEPLVQSPVALDFDESGRVFVVEFPEYNQNFNKNFKGRGRVRVLEDTHGNGVYDKSTVYVDNLDCPVAVACYDGGIFVGAVPHLWYFKDSRGDGKVDIRKPVYTGFARDPAGEAMMNSLHWGLDNRFHLSTSFSGGNVRRAGEPNERPVSVRGMGFLFDPRSGKFELTSGGGQHGMSMDDWGRTFVCDNSHPINLLMYDRRYVARNPYLQPPPASVNIAPDGQFTKLYRISPVEPWRKLRTRLRTAKLVPGPDEGGQPSGFFTGATGVTVYRGDAFPPEYRGNIFVGEVSGNLVYRARLEPDCVGFKAVRADPGVEFLASTDNWFRPVQFYNGPDGCLYVIDMYREVIETIFSMPPEILKHLDVSSGIDKGRIYRIVREGYKRRPIPRLGKATTAELVALLEHPNGWHRDTASRLLYQHQQPDWDARGPLMQLLVHSKSPPGRVRALYALDDLFLRLFLDEDIVWNTLGDREPRVREQVLCLAEQYGRWFPKIVSRMITMTSDPDIRVRYQLAFSLGEFQGEPVTQALVRLLRSDGNNPWFRLAILSSANGRAGDLLRLVFADKDLRASRHGRLLLHELAAEIGAASRQSDLDQVAKVLGNLLEGDKDLRHDLALTLVSRQTARARENFLDQNPAFRVMLDGMVYDARQAATDAKRTEPIREVAVHVLGLAPLADVREQLQQLLQANQTPSVAAAALQVLGHYEQPAVAGLILEAWPGLSPGLRKSAVEILFSRKPWVAAFLDAVERKQVALVDIEPARLKLLEAYPDAALRARARKLLAGTQLHRRQEIIDDYQKALHLKGEAARGKALFKKECSACHQLEGVGTTIGADLTAIRDWGPEKILINILDPNREVQPQYLAYLLTTKSGRVLTGMIVSETANGVTIRRVDQTSETVPRADIDELRSTGQSFMPEGLEKQLDHQAMADLLAYLTKAR